MPRLFYDLHEKIREVLEHTSALPLEAQQPLAHYKYATNAALTMLEYFQRLVTETTKFSSAVESFSRAVESLQKDVIQTTRYQTVYQKHMIHLRRMVLVSLIESFERFLKELAAVCVDNLVNYAADDRFDKMKANGGQIAAHFGAGTVGKALCESDTWLDNSTINDRFRSLLKDPFSEHAWKESLFPKQGGSPSDQLDNASTLAILWQIRHTITHNVGVITHSDGVKLRLLLRGCVQTDCVLAPREADLQYVMQFLLELADITNNRIAKRLTAILTSLHQQSPALFDAQSQADSLAKAFGLPLVIDGASGNP